MKNRFASLLGTTALLAPLALSLTLSGCVADTPSRTSVGFQAQVSVRAPVVVVYEDDYDYYPAYEVYYSRSRNEYVYLDGSSWVRRSSPRGISLDVFLAAPSVRVDFRDSPEHHHSSVIRAYPKNWHRVDAHESDRDDQKDEKGDGKKHKKGKKDKHDGRQ